MARRNSVVRNSVVLSGLCALAPMILIAGAIDATEVRTTAFAPERDTSLSVSSETHVNVDSHAGESSAAGENTLGGQVSQSVDRGVWIWTTDVVTSTGSRQNFLTFAQLKRLNGVYLYAYNLLPAYSGELKDFIDSANAIGMQVELLAGDPSWALTSAHWIGLDFVRQVVTFTASITGGNIPSGVHLDVEPYLLPGWTSDPSGIAAQYLDLLVQARQELANSGMGLTLTVDIPFWFDTVTVTHNNAMKTLNRHVQDVVDRITIMDYRDFAHGDDGIVHHALNEIGYAEVISKGVTIGVETNDVEPEKVTFFEEGETVMESELALVAQQYQTSPAFNGFAIHDFLGYVALAPIKLNYLPLVLSK